MIPRLTDLLTSLLKLPPRPHPPAGSEGSVEIFRASRRYYRDRLLQWAWKQIAALFGILVGLVFLRFELLDRLAPLRLIPFPLAALEVAALGFLIVQVPVTYLFVRLDYDFRWYFVTDRSLRVREGLFRIREQTMTFANIQNLSIRQGPLQRFFGIQDLEVTTAGGGSKSSDKGEQGNDLHKALFRGVENALEIRDRIRSHLKRQQDSGLGDPDEVGGLEAHTQVPSRHPEIVEAARELLAEVRGLRRELADRNP